MANVLVEKQSLVNAADAIRTKLEYQDLIKPEDFATEISKIGGGGGSESVEKDVNFFDYDGTLLYSYTFKEAQALTELPSLPDHTDVLPAPVVSGMRRYVLIADGWTHTLADIKSGSFVNVGACYKISDEAGTDQWASGYCAMLIETVYPNQPVTLRFRNYSTGDIINFDYGTGVIGSQRAINSNSLTYRYETPGDHLILIFPDGANDALELGYATTSGSRYNFMGISIGSGTSMSMSTNFSQYHIKLLVVGKVILAPGALAGLKCLDNIIVTRQVKQLQNGSMYLIGGPAMDAIILPPGTPIDVSYTSVFSLKIAVYGLQVKKLIMPLATTPDASFITPGTACRIYEPFKNLPATAALTSTAGYTKIRIPSNWFANGGQYQQWGATTGGTPTVQQLYQPHILAFDDRPDFPTGICMPRYNTGTTSEPSYNYALPNLETIDFRAQSTVPTLVSTADFTNRIQPGVKVVVPDSLYDSWVADAGWSGVAGQIVKASQYSEV